MLFLWSISPVSPWGWIYRDLSKIKKLSFIGQSHIFPKYSKIQ
jgi:hypothetical protein